MTRRPITPKSQAEAVPLGIHIIADFLHCPLEVLNEAARGEEILSEVVQKAGLHLVHLRAHQFSPAGYTAFALLEESHISIHTWPEKEAALIDIFTCGHRDRAEQAYSLLRMAFAPTRVNEQFVRRG